MPDFSPAYLPTELSGQGAFRNRVLSPTWTGNTYGNTEMPFHSRNAPKSIEWTELHEPIAQRLDTESHETF